MLQTIDGHACRVLVGQTCWHPVGQASIGWSGPCALLFALLSWLLNPNSDDPVGLNQLVVGLLDAGQPLKHVLKKKSFLKYQRLLLHN